MSMIPFNERESLESGILGYRRDLGQAQIEADGKH